MSEPPPPSAESKSNEKGSRSAEIMPKTTDEPAPPPIETNKKEDDESQRIELVAQKSIRVLPKMEADYENGEKLAEYAENEWDVSEEPFSAELLNVKNAPNKVSVFSGPCRTNETVEMIKKKRRSTSPAEVPPPDERPLKLAEMMGNVFNALVDGRDLSKIKVTITTNVPAP